MGRVRDHQGVSAVRAGAKTDCRRAGNLRPRNRTAGEATGGAQGAEARADAEAADGGGEGESMKAQRKRLKRAARRERATRGDGDAPNAVATAVRRLLPEIRRLVREAQR